LVKLGFNFESFLTAICKPLNKFRCADARLMRSCWQRNSTG